MSSVGGSVHSSLLSEPVEDRGDESWEVMIDKLARKEDSSSIRPSTLKILLEPW